MPASIDLVYYNSPGFARNPFEVSPARTSIRKAIQSPSPEVSITDQLLYFQKDAGQPTRSNCIRARFVAQFAHKVGIGGIRLHIEFLPVATFHQGAYKPPGLKLLATLGRLTPILARFLKVLGSPAAWTLRSPSV